jgi:uncharacterized cysteine cluster protein YcgN (CxxCxxCC family)
MVPLPRGSMEAEFRQLKRGCGRCMFEHEKKNKDIVAFLIECMELVAEHHEVLTELKKFLKKP